jgi:NAD(P)-dependent dehydrogenase (short-subunit alcohol dehydrogenase family)
MRDLSGKTVALTGAASGIGRALGVVLARAGAAHSLCDVDRTAVGAWAASTQRRHGAKDVLLNNAGVGCVATVADAGYERRAMTTPQRDAWRRSGCCGW